MQLLEITLPVLFSKENYKIIYRKSTILKFCYALDKILTKSAVKYPKKVAEIFYV